MADKKTKTQGKELTLEEAEAIIDKYSSFAFEKVEVVIENVAHKRKDVPIQVQIVGSEIGLIQEAILRVKAFLDVANTIDQPVIIRVVTEFTGQEVRDELREALKLPDRQLVRKARLVRLKHTETPNGGSGEDGKPGIEEQQAKDKGKEE